MMKIIPVVLSLVLLIPIVSVYGAYDYSGNWYCGDSKSYEKSEYSQDIISINRAVDANYALHPGITPEEIGEKIIGSHLELTGKIAQCLKESFNTDPDSVAKFTNSALGVFNANKEKTIEIAPTFAEYVLKWNSNSNHFDNNQDSSSNTNSAYVDTLTNESKGGGCLIATATYGSELSPQVQKLREIRDSKLQTTSGKSFLNGFNQFYYSFSPYVADYERENPIFKEIVKLAITPMLTTLSLMDYADSESEVLGIGISLIILNLGMYVGVPIIAILRIRKK